jgi:hypothetical protein
MLSLVNSTGQHVRVGGTIDVSAGQDNADPLSAD